MKHLEKIPDILSMYGVFTSQSTSQVRQEMSNTRLKYENIHQVQTAQEFNAKTKAVRTTTEVSPWNDQLFEITWGLKLVLHVPNLTPFSAVA